MQDKSNRKVMKHKDKWELIDKIIFKHATENEFGNLFIWEDNFDELTKDIQATIDLEVAKAIEKHDNKRQRRVMAFNKRLNEL